MTSTRDDVLTLRQAEDEDTWAVRQLFQSLHGLNADLDPMFALAPGWERLLDEHLEHVRATGNGLTLLAWEAGRPVGLIMMDGHTDSPLFRHRHWAELIALYVEPDVRGRQVSNALVREGVAWAHTRGYERVQLYVTASNERAKSFYARIGFEPVQEIWRLPLESCDSIPPDDESDNAHYTRGHRWLAPHSHHYLIDEEE